MTNKRKKIIIACAAAAVMAVIAIMAILTATTPEVTNTFTLGNTDLEISEINFDDTESDHTTLEPGQIFAKDPVLTNTGSITSHIFAKVVIPKQSVITFNPTTKEKNDAAITELFTLLDSSQNEGVNSSWTLIKSDTSNDDYNEYVYVYGTSSGATDVAPNEETAAIFNYMRYGYIVEGQGIDEGAIDLSVKGYSVQASGVEVDGTAVTTPTEEWEYIQDNVNEE